MTLTDVADHAARLTLDAFVDFQSSFRRITCRARDRFESLNWQGGRRDNAGRFDIFEFVLNGLAAQRYYSIGPRVHDSRSGSKQKSALRYVSQTDTTGTGQRHSSVPLPASSCGRWA